MAFEEFPEESGILFVHLNNTEKQLRGIRVYDEKKQPFRIKPDTVSFVLQRKASYIAPVLIELMRKNKIDEAKNRLDQIFDLLLTMNEKGYIDGDHALIRNNNIGFTKDRAIYIDTGRIIKKENIDLLERMHYEFDVRLAPLRDWLKIVYPELAAYCDVREKEVLTSLKKETPSTVASSQ